MRPKIPELSKWGIWYRHFLEGFLKILQFMNFQDANVPENAGANDDPKFHDRNPHKIW